MKKIEGLLAFAPLLLALCALGVACSDSDTDSSSGSSGGSGGDGGEPSIGDAGSPGASSGGTSSGGTQSSSGGSSSGSSGAGGSNGGTSYQCREVDASGFSEIELDQPDCAAAMRVGDDGSLHFFVIRGSDSGGTATGHYVTNADGDFTSTPIDEEAGRIRSVSLALDEDGFAHVAYDKITGSTVRYASNKTGEWVLEKVSSAPLGGAGTRLALDPDGVPNVAYKGSGSDLYLAVAGEMGWETAVVDDRGASHIRLFIEADGKRHLAFGPDDTNIAVSSEDEPGSWNSVTVGAGRVGSLARTRPGEPLRLSFCTNDSKPVELRHAVEKSPGVWSESTVIDESPAYELTAPESVVTSDGTLYVVYSMVNSIGGGCGLHLATLAPGAEDFSVRRLAIYGQTPLVALDSEDKLHLAYCSSGKLKYLKQD
jgi:hypothetical protein